MSNKLGKRLSALDEEISQQDLVTSLGYLCKSTQAGNARRDEHNKAWAGIAKIIYISHDDALKSMEPHIQRALTVAKTHELSVQLLHFVRALLYRMPSLRKSNMKTLTAFVPRVLKFAAKLRDDLVTRVACDIAAVSLADASELQLLRSLYDAVDHLPFTFTVGSGPSSFEMKVKQPSMCFRLIALAFEVHASKLRYSRIGMSVALEEWLDMATSVLQMDPCIHDAVFSWICSVILCGGFSVQPLYKKLLSMIEYGHPSVLYYRFIEAFATHLSITHQPLKMLLNSVRYPLCKQEYGEAYAGAMSALLMKQNFLLKEEDIEEVKARTCTELTDFPRSVPAIRILNALLTIDTSCSPVEFAQSLYPRLKSIHNSSLDCETRWCWSLSGMVTRLQTETVFFSLQQDSVHVEQQRRVQAIHHPKRTNTKTDTIASPEVEDLVHCETPVPERELRPEAGVEGSGVLTVTEERIKLISMNGGCEESTASAAKDQRIVKASNSTRKRNSQISTQHEHVLSPSCSVSTPNDMPISALKYGLHASPHRTTNDDFGHSDDSDSVVIISDEESLPKRPKVVDGQASERKSTNVVSGNSAESVDDILAIFES
ncbi:hypothetical protein Tcan_11345 [Toxocara canis]|uniref:Uncharacterized protein n=1 Tax=Toxocara canis TaxID=6265 RepID=A0A0B2VQK7_TOXCA|nr:hypothetical protein Tcan_11345 [Toxocara canis]